MSERDHRSKFASPAEVLHKLLEGQNGPVSDQYLRWRLWMNWKEIVGPTVSGHSEPVSYRNGVLWLWVPNSSWMQQMQFMLEPLKNTINSKFRPDFIVEIRLTTNKRHSPDRDDQNFQTNLKRFIKP